jgi:hypothetical protein
MTAWPQPVLSRVSNHARIMLSAGTEIWMPFAMDVVSCSHVSICAPMGACQNTDGECHKRGTLAVPG